MVGILRNQKKMAWLAIAGLLLSLVLIKPTMAARPDSLKDVLSDSRPSTAANHTITLDMSASTNFVAGETLIVDFDNNFDTTGFANSEAEDFDITINGAEQSIVANGGCSSNDAIEITTVNTSTDTFTFTACTSYVSTGDTGTSIVIEIGTNATSGSAGNDQIVNPTAGTYTINFAGTYGDDSQDTIVAVIAGVTVSATIDESLTFSINAVNSGSCQTTGGTAITSTSTTIPFGTISADTFYDICQDVRVATNASNGYSTTVQTQTGLDAGATAFAKGSCDGSCTDSSANTWSTAGNNGYGVCVKDTSGNAASDAGWSATNECGDGTQHFRTVADVSSSQTAGSIMASSTSVSDDRTNIGWRISADATQAAGSYTGTAVYIATPSF